MTTGKFTRGLLLSGPALLVSACLMGGNDGGGGDFVDTFTPTYTAPKGTIYTGDFFPLVPGARVTISGGATGSLRISARGTSQGVKVAQDTAFPVSISMTGQTVTLPEQTLALASGSYDVFPLATTTTTSQSGNVFDSAAPGPSTETAYYEKTAGGVNLRASSKDGADPVALAKPTFLKSPLTVGDSWESALSDLPEVAGSPSGNVAVRGRTYVTGQSTFALGTATLNTVRLDQVLELTGTLNDSGTVLQMSGQYHVIEYLADKQGAVAETMTGTMTIKGTDNSPGNNVALSEVFDMDVTQQNTDSLAVPALPKTAARPPAGPGARFHAAAWKAAQSALLRILRTR